MLYGTTTCGGTGTTGGCVYGPGGGVFYSLDVALEPFVRLLPNSGRVGAAVELLGQGFQGTTSVAFDGVPATSFHVFSDTYMTTVVPAGAKTGTVTVTTLKGILKSNMIYRIIK